MANETEFVFTAEMTLISNNLWAITSAVGAGICFLVLFIIACVWAHPKSRGHLDRVSFRIVVYALAANMIFAIASAVGGKLTGPGFLCGFSIFVLQLTLQLSSFLLFAIALNLQLVVVHGLNGQRLEKFYLITAATMSVILTVPPYAAGQYGWDPLESDCWYKNDNKTQRLVWQITTQMMWTFLTAIGEIISSITVMVFMVQHNVRLRRVFVSTGASAASYTREGRFGDAGYAPHFGHVTTAPQVIQAYNYRRIVLRIALYPIASCFVNLLSIFTALHSTAAGGIHNTTDYNILLLSDFLYGGRAIVYALLAASDPALVRGVQTLLSTLRHGPRSEHSSSISSIDKKTQPIPSQVQFASRQSHSDFDSMHPGNGGPVVHIELSTITHRDDSSPYNSPSHSNEGLDPGIIDGSKIPSMISRTDKLEEGQHHSFVDFADDRDAENRTLKGSDEVVMPQLQHDKKVDPHTLSVPESHPHFNRTQSDYRVDFGMALNRDTIGPGASDSDSRLHFGSGRPGSSGQADIVSRSSSLRRRERERQGLENAFMKQL